MSDVKPTDPETTPSTCNSSMPGCALGHRTASPAKDIALVNGKTKTMKTIDPNDRQSPTGR